MEGLVDFVVNLTPAQILAYFWPFFLLDMVRYVFLEIILICSFFLRNKFKKSEKDQARHFLFRTKPLVSVIAPGKNEGKHLAKLVSALEHQTYQNYELIVVDDGSDDNTPHICRELQAQGKIDVFIRNEIRGGKASAANTALKFSKGKYIVHVDADSHLANDSIEKIILPFIMNPDIGAVGGDVRVANSEDSFASRLQSIEYLKTITSGRTAATEMHILRIISGAHGAFRKDVLDQIKGWDVGPGLDGDITLKIRKLNYRVVHEPNAICYTNVPVSFKKLSKQRYRWDKSMVRFRMRKHLDILLPSSNFRLSTFFSVAENILFNLFFDIKWIAYFVVMLLVDSQHLGYIFIINYVLYFIANCIQYVVARSVVGFDKKEDDGFLPLFLPLMPLYTGIYLRAIRTYSYLMELLHKTSFDDAWNPWKVSKIAKREKL